MQAVVYLALPLVHTVSKTLRGPATPGHVQHVLLCFEACSCTLALSETDSWVGPQKSC